MKIAVVLGPFQPMPPTGLGAVEKTWADLSAEFAAMGHDVVLVGKGEGFSPRPGLRAIVMRGFRATGRLWQDLAVDFLYAIGITWRLPPAEVIVTNSFWTPVLLAWLRPRAGAIVVHVARFPKGQMRLYSKASVLQAISSSVAAEIVRQAPSLENKVRVLPYPVDLDVYKPPAVRRSFEGELVVLYVGRLHPEKGLELLIAALREVVKVVPQLRLRLVGPTSIDQGGGGDSWVASLREASAGLRVEFVGPLADPKQVATELARAHCFCYPSLAEKGEAFGLSVLEAMATGLPVVVSSLACFADFVRSGRDGVVFDHRRPDASKQLVNALLEVLGSPEKAAEMSENAAARAQDFALPLVAARYADLFESLSHR